METSQLRKLRFIEGLIMNIVYVLSLMLIFVGPMYLGISPRLMASLLLLMTLGSIVFSRRLGSFFYNKIFPFMKPLWDYDQQKFVSEGIKWGRRLVESLTVIGLIYLVIYPWPFPERINWLSLKYSMLGCLTGYNIGMVWNVFTEKFDLAG
ncbi:hypothetical protein DP73_01805 [Desulfosporosinus sp. HMP52]|uniref:hypothetical protein n=1 Tax=Desulfosporosinus sp. HMP52 TaxID=1487923 RepID=UPI00051FD7E8|nr:hypothetical protein [Desulfosporosinus sp. HMP52]KGK91790.1 hypothetical protein DP73_01805 [Desulfosporosinus sp. HMP52]